MMSDTGPRVVRWFDTLCDLLQQPLDEMPKSIILTELGDTFDVVTCSWNWENADGSSGVRIVPTDALLPVSAMLGQWQAGQFRDHHPLTSWFRRTGDWRPQTSDRVPSAIVSRRARQMLETPLRPLHLEKQMSIPYRGEGAMYRAFVLGRGGRDFSDDDLIVAYHVQRALIVLDRQVRHLASPEHHGALLSAVQLGLTGRELTVLQLLAEGLSTRMIGRQLGCSTRTVEKHLEHAYRKLGVRDRLNAVRTATLCGLIRPDALPREPALEAETFA